ncbi:MAG: Asp-tRNA(Asn)/Glu-tRNA(Gln) amidotransferase subunit GatA [Nitrospirae bacterium]|nr:Asp-tRNA(Asn)/Glu-tRNA(Gln) amidotransferase subunit GatA [Nitrospirota bacterium]
MDLYKLTLHELRDLIAKGEVNAKDAAFSYTRRIGRVESDIHAFTTLTANATISMAEAAEKAVLDGKVGPLTGVPFAIKDNMATKGIRTTCSSKMLENFIPPYESTVTSRLTDAGYVLLGKANMDEFAMGSSTENSAFFTTRNPWDTERIPGGSSGGSAAAVAADMCAAALGSDTGGSIRQPAACCGVVGLKPTYGRVSRYGLVAFASSLDQIGPITKDVEDSAIVMNVIGGHDPSDSTSADVPLPDFTAHLKDGVKGLKVGIPKEYLIAGGIDQEVYLAVKEAIDVLKGMGAEVKDVSLPHTDYAVATYYLLATSEASSNLARYDGVKYGYRAPEFTDLLDMYKKSRSQGFGPEVKRRIMLGTYALSSGYYDAYYKKAQQVRTLIKRDFDEAFKDVDIIVTPTAPTAAFRIGEKTDDPLQMYLSDIFTISVNLAGIPGISIPCGLTRERLPIGLQILGRHFDEETVLRAAWAYENATDWHKKRPTLSE